MSASHLHDVARAFRDALPREDRLEVFRIDGLDRTGVPVCEAALLPANGEPATIGYGYGFEPIEAEVGAVGEVLEEYFVGEWAKRAPRVQSSFRAMVERHGLDAVADPLTLCLPAGSAWTPDTPLTWVEARRFPDDTPISVPIEWVAAYPYQTGIPAELIMPITNGLGAGFDLGHALAHGLMELLQRDGNAVNYRALDQGVGVKMDAVEEPEVAALLERLRALGINVTVKLAADDFGIPNLYVVGDDPQPAISLQLTACGEAAHPDRARSLRKALLEFCGSRARKSATHGPIDAIRHVMPADMADRQLRNALAEEQEPRPVEAMAEWLAQDAAELRRRLAGSVFRVAREVPFSALPDAGPALSADAGARLDWLVRALAAEGLDVIWVDCSPPGGSVRVVKAIVPGLESETMSYGRLGWRGVRRLRARRDPLLLDSPAPGALRVRLRPEDETRCGGPAWWDAPAAERLVAPLFPLYRESGPFAAQLLLAKRCAA
ncbi:YcaO-like family protein [Sabulicella glaciei]|uniref:YcaO-like family protein n=1 Tax=Sabulicella glaciei TaxID=2984948 RepID=A0ABT3NU53_9PROT|nr:YcaO-like family protein [Roseococcus sp. MDT2-1-1]MCW8085695.1 YcaO-like family protein [Roseococcus sp. MDT2-1-1]